MKDEMKDKMKDEMFLVQTGETPFSVDSTITSRGFFSFKKLFYVLGRAGGVITVSI